MNNPAALVAGNDPSRHQMELFMSDRKSPESLQYHPSTEHMRSLADPTELAIADKIHEINSRFIPFKRDELLNSSMRAAILSLTAPLTQRGNKRQILALCGESGAGKSTAIEFHIRRHKELQPYVDEEGVLINPVFIFDGPKPCTPRLLAIEALDQLKVYVPDRISAAAAWSRFRQHLRKRKIKLVVIDEAQNAIDGASEGEQTDIADAFKQLVQMKGWRVCLALVGVPPLAEFMTRKQLANRKSCVQFEPFDADADSGVEIVTTIMQRVIEDHAGLTISEKLLVDDETDEAPIKRKRLSLDFIGRLAHSGTNDLGTMIKTVREATELALYARRDEVTLDDFAEAYATSSGCRETENVFKAGASQWPDIIVADAALREGDFKWREEHGTRKPKQPRPSQHRIRGE